MFHLLKAEQKPFTRGKTPSLATSETPSSASQIGREDPPLFRKLDSLSSCSCHSTFRANSTTLFQEKRAI